MSTEEARYSVNRLYRKHIAWQVVEILLQSLGLSILSYSLLSLFSNSQWALTISSLFLLVALIALAIIRNLHKLGLRGFLSLLNFRYPELEQSLDLLLTDSAQLTELQRVQQSKVIGSFSRIRPSIKLPHKIVSSLLLFTACFVSAWLLQYRVTGKSQPDAIPELRVLDTSDSTVFIKTLIITVSPPLYTKIDNFTQAHNISAPVGSVLRWEASFSSEIDEAALVYSARDTLSLNGEDTSNRKVSLTPKNRGFYQLLWKKDNKVFTSDFYKIELTEDNAPAIAIKNLEQFTEVTHEINAIDLKATLSDDYGLSDASIIATVSKGSGESVKFREVTMRFRSPAVFKSKEENASLTFDLKKLGLEPGDELYFYIEAFDNRTPLANKGRTETYFIALKDTATYYAAADDGLGVDLMPDYFRSQRQIIIDTEKLIKNQKKLSKEQFNFTSNELGYDQKVLRLRYSEFMGEEFVSGIGPQAAHEEEAHAEEDLTKTFGHVHDSENEHNLVEEKHKEEEHGHHHEESNDPDKKENPLAEFVHAHDDPEEATFFVQSVKAKLRAALTMMWDAELHLRMFEPKKSLPYQYKILNLLKEIANDSRIYVHRTGFDPPPIKEEKRYTAELHEIKSSTASNNTKPSEELSSVKHALLLIDQYIQQDVNIIPAKDALAFKLAGIELAKEAIADPGRYIEALQFIKEITSSNTLNKVLLTQTRRKLIAVLPPEVASPVKSSSTLHVLDSMFMNQLNVRHE